jgi:ankyrin repeat protein
MKRSISSSNEDTVAANAELAATSTATKEPAPDDEPAEGARLPSVNAASPQVRRMLRFTLVGGGSASHRHVDTAPSAVATFSVSLEAAPRYAPAGMQRPAMPPGAERPARKTHGVTASDQAFAAWRRSEAARESIAPAQPLREEGPAIDLAACAQRAVREGADAWLRTRLMLQKDERIRFLMESLPQVIDADWSAAVDLILREAPLERLQRKTWQGGCRLAHLVLRFGNRDYIRRVFSQSALKDALPHLDRDGMTPLHLAVVADDTEATARILDFQDLADALLLTPNTAQWLPIHLAARAGAVRAAEHLLLRQASAQRCRTADGQLCAIHIAAIHARPRFVKLLLKEHAQKQLCATDGLGRNALMHAVRWGASAVVKELLAVESAQREQLLQRDQDGMSALQHAQAGGNAEVIGQIEAALRKAFPQGDGTPLPAGPAPTPQGGKEESAQEPQE